MTGRERRSGWRDALQRVPHAELLLVALFVLSRLLLHQAGVAIDHLPVEGTWQLVEAELLRERLFESLFYLHSQPPLYNLLVGVLLGLFDDPGNAARALDVLYAGLGLLMVLLVHHLMRRLGAGPRVSFAAAALFTLSPAALLYENYAFYTHPAAVLVCLCAVLFARTVDAFSFWRALALFGAMAVLVYLRALFQVHWFLALAALAVWLSPGHRRAVALAAALPLVLVLGLYAKNAFVFGQLGTSSWLGMSLAKSTTMRLPLAERRYLVAAGELSPLALQRPFSAPQSYPAFVAAAPTTGVPVLDRPRKSGRGINFNHRAYPAISRQYLRDAIAVTKRHPAVYLESVAIAHLMYFRPSADYAFLERQRARIAPWVRAYNLVIAGQPVYSEDLDLELGGAGEIGYFIVLAFLVCVGSGAAAAWRCRKAPGVSARDAVLVFLWLNVLYVTLVGNTLEMDENQRFRVLINPLLAVMLVGAISGERSSPNAHGVRARSRPAL